jgi:hypothetical protein
MREQRIASAAAAGSIVASLVTGASCILPLLAILLGASGFGFLTRYAWLRGPATVATLVLLAVGFLFARRAPNKSRGTQLLIWLAVAFAIGINLFEYLILQTLA